jgi:hypothetical protein
MSFRPVYNYRKKGGPRTSRGFSEIQWAFTNYMPQPHQKVKVINDNTVLVQNSMGGKVYETLNGNIPTLTVTRNAKLQSTTFYLNGREIKKHQIGISIGHEITDFFQVSDNIRTQEGSQITPEGLSETQPERQESITSGESSEVDAFELLGIERSMDENDINETIRVDSRSSEEVEVMNNKEGSEQGIVITDTTIEESFRAEKDNTVEDEDIVVNAEEEVMTPVNAEEEVMTPVYEDIVANTIDGLLTINYPFMIHRCSVCREILEDPKKLVEHMDRKHIKEFITFKCSLCGKVNGKLKGIAIHYGICRKKRRPRTSTETTTEEIIIPSEPIQLSPNRFASLQVSETENPSTSSVQQEYQCQECETSFKSKIGLGQHIRHMHPCTANQRRLEAVQKDIDRKREKRKKDREELESKQQQRKRPGLWTEEETKLLEELCKKYEGARYINVEIAKEMPGKTNKQISDKRRALAAERSKMKNKKAQESSSNQTTSSTNDFSRLKRTDLPKESYRNYIITEGGDLIGNAAECLLKAIENEDYTEHLEKLMEEIMNICKKEKNGDNKKKKGKTKGKKHANKTKLNKYREQQRLYYKDRKALAKLILDEKGSTSGCEIDIKEIEEVYMERFGGQSQEVDLTNYPIPTPVDSTVLLAPFTPEEIVKGFKKMKKDTAAGPDNIDIKEVIKFDRKGHLLTNLFNIFLVGRKIPKNIKQNRSILLPKGENNLDNINNWRPLTISSVILRLYTSLIAKRVLTAYKINPRQRGFIEASGCSENSTLLSAVIDDAKRNHKELHVTFLDLAKAFDTVSHKHIVAGLERYGTPTQFIDIVRDMYENITTSFQCGTQKTKNIPMTRGVKQGDPLSPLLFNISMDPLLEQIDCQNNGYRYGQSEEDNISSFCYADDNALTTSSSKGMNINLQLVQDFCIATGMKLNIKKSACFSIIPAGKKSYTVNTNKEKLNINGEPIPLIGPVESLKYLGSKMSPWTTKVKKDLIPWLEQMLKNLSSSCLKPRQKIVMLNHYTLPRLNYPLTQDRYPHHVLEKIDLEVRRHVRKWLKLPDCSPISFFHLPRAKGGLGISQFRHSIPAQRINMLRGIINSNDPCIHRMAEALEIQRDIDKLIKNTELKIPIDPQGRVRWRHLVEKQAQKLKIHRSARSFNHKEANSWLNPDQSSFNESDFISACMLRAETYPCKTVLARGREGLDVNCRRCHLAPETIGHISGHCHSVKDYRIKRHNAIVRALEEKLKKNEWDVSIEPIITDNNNQRWKPDILAIKGPKALIIDPTIVYEQDHSLQRANHNKNCKYEHLKEIILDKYNVGSIEVCGLAVGARGGWCEQNTTTLKKLGIESKGFREHICRLAFKGTINLIRLFMDQ